MTKERYREVQPAKMCSDFHDPNCMCARNSNQDVCEAEFCASVSTPAMISCNAETSMIDRHAGSPQSPKCQFHWDYASGRERVLFPPQGSTNAGALDLAFWACSASEPAASGQRAATLERKGMACDGETVPER